MACSCAARAGVWRVIVAALDLAYTRGVLGVWTQLITFNPIFFIFFRVLTFSYSSRDESGRLVLLLHLLLQLLPLWELLLIVSLVWPASSSLNDHGLAGAIQRELSPSVRGAAAALKWL